MSSSGQDGCGFYRADVFRGSAKITENEPEGRQWSRINDIKTKSAKHWIEKYIQIGSELSSVIIQTEPKDFQISKSPAEGQYTNQYILMGILVKFVKGEQLCV